MMERDFANAARSGRRVTGPKLPLSHGAYMLLADR